MSREHVIGGPHCPGCASKYSPVNYDFSGIAKMLAVEVAKMKKQRKRKQACAEKKGGG